MLNPPFSQDDEELHELYFVLHMLNLLKKGGTGVAVVPLSCAVAPHKAKEQLLESHTLEGVLSLPNELFAPVGVITCAMIFTAGTAHKTSDRKTWFGFCKDDGFVRTKHLGRVDLAGKWPNIRDGWVDSFRNKETEEGKSIMQKVGPQDEWCAEAYMTTDYSTLSESDFDAELRKYVAFQIMNSQGE